VTTGEEISYSVKVFYENYLFEKHSQAVGLMGGYSTTEDDPLHTSGNKSESGRNN